MSDLESSQTSVLVIGGGPAGYTAAIRAAQLGAKVILVEKERLGGACLNYACVPTKFLRYAGELMLAFEKAPRYGFAAEAKKPDWAVLQTRRQDLIDNQVEGLRGLLEGNGVEVVFGEAHLHKRRIVSVVSEEQTITYQADKIIIATGSVVSRPSIPGAGDVMSSRELLRLDSPPRSLAIIGGGPVGVELATIFARFGTAVSLVEMMPRILPGEDAELARLLEKELKKASVRLMTGNRLQHIEKTNDGYRVILTNGEQAIDIDNVTICTGQRPFLDNVNTADLTVERGALVVNTHLCTGSKGVYAAGDVTGKAFLAYVAMKQGRVAAENAMGFRSVMNYDAIPRCVFSIPELASVGLTEEDAKAKYPSVKVGRAPFAANTAATIYGERRGLVKVITETEKGRLLGVHILGPGASNIIHEAALAIKMRATVADIQRTLHIHPSLAEALWDSAYSITDR